MSTHRFSVLFAALLAICTPSSAQVIQGIQATKGSTEGGTYLTIWGSGFHLNKQGQLNVFIGTTVCPIVKYFSTDSTIVCYTPPGTAG